jgi:hypothetical protein
MSIAQFKIGDVSSVAVRRSHPDDKTDYDLLFVHGLSSSASEAWANPTGYLWPQWLADLFPNVRIELLNYPAPKFFYSAQSRLDIEQRSRNLLNFLSTINVGTRPTIFVCHSLGGLIVKEMIRQSQNNPAISGLARSVVGAIFLATPHLGSNLASLAQVVGSSITRNLAYDSEYLVELKDWFRDYVQQNALFVSAYAETQPYNGCIVVDALSADPGCANCTTVQLDYDHVTICKPLDPTVDLFQRLKRDIRLAQTGYEAMSRQITSVIDAINMPFLTMKMYIKINSLILEEIHQRFDNTWLISNVSRGSKPQSVIVTRNDEAIEFFTPLVDRFPDEFIIENALLGEFTSEIPTVTTIKFTYRIIRNFVAVLLDVMMPSKISSVWRDEEEVFVTAAAHVFDRAIRRTVRTCLFEADEFADDYNFTGDLAKLRVDVKTMRGIGREQCIYDAMTTLYAHDALEFKVEAEPGVSSGHRRFKGRFHHIDFHRDIAIIAFTWADPDNRANGLERWFRTNSRRLKRPKRHEELKAGDVLQVLDEGLNSVTVTETDAKVWFHVEDKVTRMRDLLVLSGARTRAGSSGAPVLNDRGVVVAMIIGRTKQVSDSSYLAIRLSNIDSGKPPKQMRAVARKS